MPSPTLAGCGRSSLRSPLPTPPPPPLRTLPPAPCPPAARAVGYELEFTAKSCYYPTRSPCTPLVNKYASYAAVPKSVPNSLAPGVWGARVYSVQGSAKTLELTYNFTVGSL